jgi:hypothetical protein
MFAAIGSVGLLHCATTAVAKVLADSKDSTRCAKDDTGTRIMAGLARPPTRATPNRGEETASV